MREILFRGKDIKGNWFEGLLCHNKKKNEWYISNKAGIPTAYQVRPETIGQYTGLKDRNGTRIFEGDICWFYGGDYYSGLWEQNAIVAITDITDDEQTHYLNNAEYCEVIGNIHDNPELLNN